MAALMSDLQSEEEGRGCRQANVCVCVCVWGGWLWMVGVWCGALPSLVGNIGSGRGAASY